MIKFLELNKINSRFEKEFEKGFKDFLESGWYILGSQSKTFEEAFSKFCGTKYCVGVSNGLDALTLILKGYIELGRLKKDDEVIVPANTYIASILAIIHAGLKPVLVEPDVETFNIDSKLISNVISNKTRAIIPVHLYGQLADMETIKSISKEFDLLIIEDAAQAHGATNASGIKAGNMGDVAGFSFYPTKNLGALGDAGCVTTNDHKLKDTVSKLRNYGQYKKYVSNTLGSNARLDEIQAMFLNIKLKILNDDNEIRRNIARRYLSEVHNLKIKLPKYSDGEDHVFHQFVVRVNDQNNFRSYMSINGVETLVHYPVPPHKQGVLKSYENLSFPVTELLCKSVVSIPINPILCDSQIDHIIELLNQY
jgi:dTDP-4-amino-4,6-dideoxygalactose transaminase